MTAHADDDRIVDATALLRSAMSLLNDAGAMQAAAHVATAIFCMPTVTAPRHPADLAPIVLASDDEAGDVGGWSWKKADDLVFQFARTSSHDGKA
jgi:hypothetical protein